MSSKLYTILDKLKKLLVHYPLVLLFSFATVLVILYGIEMEPNKEQGYLLLRLGLVFSLGISSQFAVKMLAQRHTKGYVGQVLGVLFLIGYYFIFPREEKDFTEVYAFILFPTFILSHLLVSYIAFLNQVNSEGDFWEFNKNLFINLFLTVVFTGVLTGGVELALLAIKELFNCHFSDKVFFETFATLAILGSTIIFLLFSDTGLPYLEKKRVYPIILKFFTQFILIPLLLLYLLILYFYSVKITWNWELPRGWVSYLVLAYSIVGILALLLVHPLKSENVKSWVLVFNRVYYYTLIPLLILLFTAIFTRVLQYGYTEARYFVLLLALWLTTVVLYFVLNRKASIKFIPVSLFLFGLIALVFPYFNAFSVSKRSQEKELKALLSQNHMLVNGKIDFSKPILDSVKYEVESKLRFLSQRHDVAYLKTFLDAKTKRVVDEDIYWYTSLFTHITYTDTNEHNELRIFTRNDVLSIQSYDYLAVNDYGGTFETTINHETLTITPDPTSFTVAIGEAQVDVLPQIKALFTNYRNATADVLVKDISVVTALKNYKIKIIFNSVSWNKKEDLYTYDQITYLVKIK